jgi:hypothetical protein
MCWWHLQENDRILHGHLVYVVCTTRLKDSSMIKVDHPLGLELTLGCDLLASWKALHHLLFDSPTRPPSSNDSVVLFASLHFLVSFLHKDLCPMSELFRL